VPSAEHSGWPEVEEAAANARITRVEKLGSAIALEAQGYAYDALGNAVHAFLAADVGAGEEEERLACAKRLLGGAGMSGLVQPESLLEASSQFQGWVAARWPGAHWRREVPIDAFIPSAAGERRLSGIIDLLLETDDGCVIVDHKTFPGSTEGAWRARCAKFAPQLMAYAEALRRVEGKRVLGCWIHLPVGGGMVEISSGVRAG
jgi:ATP-dependent exoDNAse (exonuclease V) beta subunit